MNLVKERVIDGNDFEKLITSGVYNLKKHIDIVNDLNVFPVPDGDTGDNMYLTINGGLNSLKNINDNAIGVKAEALANGMLLNARGNSGVILSQFFYGIALSLKDKINADTKVIAEAFKEGVSKAYASVVNPVEGTMLTVIREATENAINNLEKNESIGDFFDYYLNEMKSSLDRTPDLLFSLKEADVVDSGGKGLVYIVEGMKSAIDGKEIENNEEQNVNISSVDFSKFNEDSIMEYGYCTEFLLQLQKCKCDVNSFDVKELIKFLETIGDSIVAVKTNSIVKVHVHTLTPYKALEYAQRFGEYLTVKIENMTLQHNDLNKKEVKKIKKERTKYGIIAVLNGQGLKDTFYDLGVDVIIDGGQTSNPSIESFIEAFDECNADNIFVFPNNSNIIMAANKAKELYSKSNIIVINSKNIGEAYSSISLLDYSSDNLDEIKENFEINMQNVTTAMLTKSIRNALINNVDIKENDYIGFKDKIMLTSNKDKLESYFELLNKLDIEHKNYLINIYGKDLLNKEKEIIEKYINDNYPSLEYYSIEGDQEIYDVILIME